MLPTLLDHMGWHKMPEVEDRAHPTKAEVLLMLQYEADRMHHNATLLHQFPLTSESQDLRVDDLFWDRLSTYVEHVLCPSLSGQIKRKFGVDLTFCQYGRSGATIAPSEWIRGRNGEYFGIDGDRAIEDILYQMTGYWDDGNRTNLSEFNAHRRLHTILEFINDFWGNQAAHCEEWWAQEVAYLKEEPCKP